MQKDLCELRRPVYVSRATERRRRRNQEEEEQAEDEELEEEEGINPVSP